MGDDISVAESERPRSGRCASTLRNSSDDHVHRCFRHNEHALRATIDEPRTPFHECGHAIDEADDLLGLHAEFCDVRWDEQGQRLP